MNLHFISSPAWFTLLILQLLLCAESAHGRQPAYFVLGEDQFKGVQIYDVIQDKKLNYWFSTNEGLLFYDHYVYRKIACPASRSISFFNFVINQNGTIFCNNLNNQIFAIRKNQCQLIYELTPDETQSDLSLAVTQDNKLLVSGRKLILLDENGTVLNRHDVAAYYVGIPSASKPNQIIIPLPGSDSVTVYENGQFYDQALIYEDSTSVKPGTLQLFNIGSQAYALDLKNKMLYYFDEQTYSLRYAGTNPLFMRSESVRIYSTSEGLWLAGTLPGVLHLKNDVLDANREIYYPQAFISDIYEDAEKNILVSTFDYGVFVITDLKVPDLIKEYEDDPFVVIKPSGQFGLLLGSSRGKLIALKNNRFEVILDQGKRAVEVIVDDDRSDFLIFDDGYIRVMDKKTGNVSLLIQSSLKDGVITGDHISYLATNSGLLKVYPQNGKSGTMEITRIEPLQFRNYAVEFDSINKTLYVSTINGLFLLDSSDRITEIKYNNESIFCPTLCLHENKIYGPLTKSGILIFEDGRVTGHIEPRINGKTAIIFKMLVHGNSIFAHTDEGLCEFDMQGKFIRSLNNTTGQSHRRILDFTITADRLWISNPEGLQSIDLNYPGQPIPSPLVSIETIYVNDQKIAQQSAHAFDSDMRKFEFHVSSPTLRYKTDIRYHYKLEGYDQNWSVNDYSSNQILYNALAPGDYTFLVKAENNGKFSETVRYSFSIALPYYLSWWFIASVLFVFLLIVFFIYKRQLNIQRVKAKQINELNASRLTAIQSQMNPHFIFNSLNSIQDLILKGDIEHSYSYITTFSDLVRRTLVYSDKDFIDFEQELKLLELYLSLEKLRFKKDMNYTIEYAGISDIQIPPMLIQPFIENALLHGLLHKEGIKELRISFMLNENLTCIIEDNGIGRNQARIIRERQRGDHESFSVQAIRKRFEILSDHFKGALGYRYEDLEENGKATGTRVILQIPVKYKY